MKAKIVTLPGDGVGPEVAARGAPGARSGRRRASVSELEFESHLMGGIAIDETGEPLPDATLAACRKRGRRAARRRRRAQVGRPERQGAPRARACSVSGRRWALYANLRPVKANPALIAASPLKPERVNGVDLLVVRELTGGLYFGKPRLREKTPAGWRAVDTLEYSETEIARVVRLAFQLARGRRSKLTSVDKANVLESSRLWRQVTNDISREFSDVTLEHQLVDSCAMRLVTAPTSFDVLVTENMFGDILSDEASVLSGSLGMLPSASLGEGKLGLYEPIHGSAPDIAGQGIANPLGTIQSAAMLLRHSLGLETEAAAVEAAVNAALAAGARTRDLGGELSTRGMGQAVLAELERG